jgi:RNA polymerase sigma factor (sigma-70 family)
MPTLPDNGASDVAARQGVGSLLLRWQSRHDPDDFAALLALVREPLERFAAKTLRQSGIRDPGACDEVVAVVFERLVRLGEQGGARPPLPFVLGRCDAATTSDPGWAFICCLARSRARDVARALRRRERLVAGYAASAATRDAWVADRHGSDATDIERFHAAIAALDERSREVVELLLDGKSQAVIAHMLGVCEGTVSRIRAKAIARLRGMESS